MAKKKKKRLKKSFKIGVVIGFLAILLATMCFIYLTQIAAPKPVVHYGEIEDKDANGGYGKIEDPYVNEESVGEKLTYTVFKLKTGNCIFIDHGDTEVLIDAGGNAKEGAEIAKKIRDDVKDELDYVIATNPTPKRIGGMPEIYKNYRVGTTYYSKENDSKECMNFKKAAEKSMYQEAKDTNIKVGPAATLSIYNVSEGAVADEDFSLVTSLVYSDINIVEIGDLSEKFEARTKNKFNKMNVLIVNELHSTNYIKTMAPGKLLIASPKATPKKILEEISQTCDIYSTVKHGDLSINYDGVEYKENYEDKDPINIRK